MVNIFKLSKSLGPFQECLKDSKRHFSQRDGWFILVNTFIQVSLSKSFQTEFVMHVNQVRGFNSITNRKCNLLKNFTADGVFTRKRLYNSCKLGKKEGKEWTYKNFVYASTPGVTNSAGNSQWPVIKCFHIFHLFTINKWCYQSVHKPWMYVTDVRININNDVAFKLVDCLPEIFAFTHFRLEIRENIG